MQVPKRPIVAAASVSVLLLLIAFGSLAMFELRYAGRAYPGVSLQGRDIGGLTAEQIFELVNSRSDAYYDTATLSIQTPEAVVALRPSDFGAGIDPAATVARALAIGRQGDLMARLRSQYQTWREGASVDPVVVLDGGAVRRLSSIMAAEVERQPRNAGVQVSAGGVREIPAQTGITLDTETLSALIGSVATRGEPATIALPLKPVQAKLSSAADAVADITRIIGSDLVVAIPRWDESGKIVGASEAFRITPANLPDFISVEQVAGQNGDPVFQIKIRRDRFKSLIEPLAKAVNTSPENARLKYDPAARNVQVLAPSQVGHMLDVDATLNAIEAALRSQNRGVTLITKDTPPAVSGSATAADLGITGLITQATTYFKGSSEARMKNVQVAASRFNGVVIPPGGTFSFNEYLGDVSVEEGFEEGLIIVGDRTIKGVGGGVCQVSTTAYQAALRAGFPILERTPHAYRVSYYERGMGPGLDATVFSPIVDMKFKNDTAGHLIIEPVYDGKNATLTFRFWGRPDGRDVSFSKATINNVVPHGPDIYEPDPDGKIAAGKAKQVDYAVDGATTSVSRVVRKDGQVVRKDTINSRYVPWQAVYRYGPGFTPPEGAQTR